MKPFKGKPHDVSIYCKQVGLVIWQQHEHFRSVPRPISCRITGKLQNDQWYLTLSLVDEECGPDAPMMQIPFDRILKELNRRIGIVELTRMSKPD